MPPRRRGRMSSKMRCLSSLLSSSVSRLPSTFRAEPKRNIADARAFATELKPAFRAVWADWPPAIIETVGAASTGLWGTPGLFSYEGCRWLTYAQAARPSVIAPNSPGAGPAFFV